MSTNGHGFLLHAFYLQINKLMTTGCEFNRSCPCEVPISSAGVVIHSSHCGAQVDPLTGIKSICQCKSTIS